MRDVISIIAGGLAVCTLTAGCDRREAPPSSSEGKSVVAATPPPTSGASPTEAPKSIIRPTVADEPPPPPPIETETLTVTFGDRTMTLNDDGRAQLDALMDSRTMSAGGPIILRGHSDSRGYDGDNLVASRKRAEAVRDYLEKQGVAAKRMTVIALGETRPIAPNANLDGSDNPEGRAKNRRVQIEVQPPAEGADDPSQAEDGAPVAVATT